MTSHRVLAQVYYRIRVCAVPLKFINSVVMGVLGGYQRIYALMVLQILIASVQVLSLVLSLLY
jgi:hypothetical protein